MRAVLALAANDLRLLSRRRGDLFFTLGWPLIVAVFFGLLFAGPPEGRSQIEIALADEDGTDGSRAFADRLAQDPALSVVLVSREEAEALVRQGKRPACVILKEGFGAAAARPFFLTPQAEIGTDPARKAEAGMLEGLLARAAAGHLQALLQDREATRKMVKEARSGLFFAPPGNPEGLAATDRFLSELGVFLDQAPGGPGGPGGFQPIAVETKPITAKRRGPLNSFEFSFPQGILWGIIGCAATFGVGLVAERNAGTLMRLLVAPLTRTHVLLGKALACFVAILAVEALLLLVGALVFRVRPASSGLLVAACLAVAVAFVGLMMLISTLGQTERSASGAGWAILLVLSMLGGGMVPLFVMPPWMAIASHLSPVKWAVLALEGALWRGFTAVDMALPCAILLGVGLLAFFLGARRFQTA